jgi:hypothetical protein
MIDQFFQVLRLDLRERQRNAVFVERGIQLVVGLGRDQAGQADAGP